VLIEGRKVIIMAVHLETTARSSNMQNLQSVQSLYKNRNRTVARSFFRQLKSEGFSHEQIIDLSTSLLDLVTHDIRQTVQAEAK
jgi:hypothetical protein